MNHHKNPSTTETPTSHTAAEPKRRAYQRPSLTDLGSVRDLTLAATGSTGDGGALQPQG